MLQMSFPQVNNLYIENLGCIFAQLFIESNQTQPLFSLSRLLAYKRGDSSHMKSQIQKIQNQDIRDMITHMLDINPQNRFTAAQYLEKFSGSVFPKYFEILHENILKDMVS